MTIQSQSNRRGAALLAVVALVLLSGCATISVHSTVTPDGTVGEYEMQINTSSTVYGFLNEAAKDNGYDSLREQFTADIDEEAVEEITYDEEFNGDDVTLTLTISEFDPPSDSSLSITEEDGTLVYEDRTFVNESARASEQSEMSRQVMSGLVVHYYLEMPGKITDSNADEVDGNTAEWHETGAEAFTDNRIYAESEAPSGLGVGVPGFGIGAALVALLIVAGFSRRY